MDGDQTSINAGAAKYACAASAAGRVRARDAHRLALERFVEAVVDFDAGLRDPVDGS